MPRYLTLTSEYEKKLQEVEEVLMKNGIQIMSEGSRLVLVFLGSGHEVMIVDSSTNEQSMSLPREFAEERLMINE